MRAGGISDGGRTLPRSGFARGSGLPGGGSCLVKGGGGLLLIKVARADWFFYEGLF